MAKTKRNDNMLDLIRKYNEVTAELKPLEQRKTEIWSSIKELMGKDEERIVPGFGKVTYAYDKDKEVVEFDREAFKKAEPKLYKKYVTVKTVKGSRRLLLKGLEEE